MKDERKSDQTILIVDDDEHIRELLRFLLDDEGHAVECAEDGEQALCMVRPEKTGLVILDINLPGIDGFTVCRELGKLEIPVLFLSSRDEEHDVIYGLEIGALDYIRKPFNNRELILRVENLIGRKPSPPGSHHGYQCGGLRIDLEERSLLCNGCAVHLSPIEFDLLALLMSRRGAVVSNKEILGNIWGNDDWIGGQELVKVNIRRLRMKIEPDPHSPTYIVNQWGRGYRFQGAVTKL